VILLAAPVCPDFFSFNPISAEALARGRGAENAERRKKEKN
jgi:hypothetical protein